MTITKWVKMLGWVIVLALMAAMVVFRDNQGLVKINSTIVTYLILSLCKFNRNHSIVIIENKIENILTSNCITDNKVLLDFCKDMVIPVVAAFPSGLLVFLFVEVNRNFSGVWYCLVNIFLIAMYLILCTKSFCPRYIKNSHMR